MTSLVSLLKRPETKEAILQNLREHLKEHSENAVNAAVDHAYEQGLDRVILKVSSWQTTSDAFTDAFKMIIDEALKIATHTIATQKDDSAFRSMRPDMPSIDKVQAEVILNGREPSMLKELYVKAMQTKHTESVADRLSTKDTQEPDLDLDQQALRKWAKSPPRK